MKKKTEICVNCSTTPDEILKDVSTVIQAYSYQIQAHYKNSAMKLLTRVTIINDLLSDLKKVADDAGFKLEELKATLKK